jgi:protein-disulfide isomerase-like protein with CxxC motif
MAPLHVTHFTDPGCPWAWSASPALAVLRWRYGNQLEWRHVMIGLTERGSEYDNRGYTPTRMALGYRSFRHRGMPFATEVRERVHGTGPMCRVVVAARRLAPESEWAVLRALQFAQFTTALDLEEPAALREALAWMPGVDGDALVDAAFDPETETAYQADRREARMAAGGATEFQGKSATTAEGEVRYTAPSLLLDTEDGRRLEVGGFQPVEAYDVAIANLDRSLTRRAPAEDAAEVLAAFPDGLTTAEVAAVMAPSNTAPDFDAAEDALIAAAAAGDARREAFGHDALWLHGARRRAELPSAA